MILKLLGPMFSKWSSIHIVIIDESIKGKYHKTIYNATYCSHTYKGTVTVV